MRLIGSNDNIFGVPGADLNGYRVTSADFYSVDINQPGQNHIKRTFLNNKIEADPRYYDKRNVTPLFAFGHGLSYTTFDYSRLRLPAKIAFGQPITVSFDVKNSGGRAAKETVQLYLGDEATMEVVRPRKELKALRKVALAPGESTTVQLALSSRDFSYYDLHRRGWVTTPGKFRVYVGSSSADI